MRNWPHPALRAVLPEGEEMGSLALTRKCVHRAVSRYIYSIKLCVRIDDIAHGDIGISVTRVGVSLTGLDDDGFMRACMCTGKA